MRLFYTISKSEKSRRIHKIFRFYYLNPSQEALALYDQYHAHKSEALIDQLRQLILEETESQEIHTLLD